MADKEDKLVQQQRRREKRIKKKMNLKERIAEDDDGDNNSGSEGDADEVGGRRHKKSKIYFDSDSDNETKGTEVTGGNEGISKNVTLEEQEALALKLLNSMHS